MTSFDYVQVIGYYNGSSAHDMTIQLYDWATGLWATWNKMVGELAIDGNSSFWVPCPDNYISGGTVKVRIYHPINGNAAHSSSFKVVALYDRNATRDADIEDLQERMTDQEEIVSIYNETDLYQMDYGKQLFRETVL